jgi:Ca2+/H+ antiporter, TMEM165/GDT1 family
MEALINSCLAVSLAEIGDKTQLLALFLAAKYRRPYTICAGILLATLLNHALSAWLGAWLGHLLPPERLPYLVAASFLALAFWLLVPDKDENDNGRFAQWGPLLASAALFFLAEIGDKTQIATMLLAAKYQELPAVVVGTTLGMLIANIPVVFAGQWLMQRLPLDLARRCAFALFLALALFTAIGAYTG